MWEKLENSWSETDERMKMMVYTVALLPWDNMTNLRKFNIVSQDRWGGEGGHLNPHRKIQVSQTYTGIGLIDNFTHTT